MAASPAPAMRWAAGVRTATPRCRDRRSVGAQPKRCSGHFSWPVLRIWEFAKPTISRIHGYCIGGGTCFGLVTDITIASEDADFQMPLTQGLGFPSAETMIEPWIFMNWKRTCEHLYTSQTLTAQQALEMGLVNRVVPLDELESTVEQLAATIAQARLSALMGTKTMVKRMWEMMGLRVRWQMSEEVVHLVGSANDVKEWRAAKVQQGLRPRQIAEAAAKAAKPRSRG